jgi:putative sterol carrier protein
MNDSIAFATDRWIKRLADECNNNKAYQDAARNWEGDIYFIVEPDDPQQEPIYMYMDLYHGRCRQAFVPDDCDALNPEFRISGSLKVWQAIAKKQIDPMKALLTRQLSVKGNMTKIMRNVKAANALVNCTTKFETDFPLE